MHWVDRGPEPSRLRPICSRYIARWVRYYRDGTGSKPSDSRWREFRGDLEKVFFNLCAYCEEYCRGEVEHFRPKSRFPELVYEWSNWLFACHVCNQMKGEKWPSRGYVDPCAQSTSAPPETFFEFDAVTGEVLPRQNMASSRRQKAMQMINDLQLNASYHLKKRRLRLDIIEALSRSSDANPGQRNLLEKLAARTTGLSSITRVKLVQLGYSLDIA